MPRMHASDDISMLAAHPCGPYDVRMLPTPVDQTRTLTLVLPESDWRALRDAEPDAIAWLQAQIRGRLSASGEHHSTPLPLDEEDDY
jgi:hypothetical protein